MTVFEEMLSNVVQYKVTYHNEAISVLDWKHVITTTPTTFPCTN